ncbi:hypothetical protein ERO13_D12G250000v2 [Gossypium hirsutum]|uniref:Uncharacterized protein At4g00950 n=1 Tax=Gossypium hirsutum TaxID=3635 RepID=A0A1U8NE36_GOSHI|nr:uncharacterized protein At4g00950-like [Gossypium hirsutum]KAG4117742.1 hypothetical protein ERO13_D12G250000v2 [Gossypium hirsutum]
MGSVVEFESETTHTPKLSLYLFPSKAAEEPPGIATPPIHTSASIPFQWEEAPGKPRSCPAAESQPKPHTARCLELPPRLLAEAKVANMPSPTTVLDGPDSGRVVSRTLSFRKGGSFRSPDNKRLSKEKVLFGSSRWGSFRKAGRVVQGSSFGSSDPPVVDGRDGGGSGGGTQVKITRVRRKGRLLSLTQARSHVLASIYESFKQVVPWRRGEGKMKKKGS